VGPAVELLAKRHAERIAEIESMPQRTLDSVWWPFTQHSLVR
jgi:dethiobiotin synthetase/adenosylmethionine--8-amino-7-oxononanoate aminotransferase